jgi:hypothetical protein
MTNKEMVDRDITLTFDFIRAVVKNPKLLDRIESGSTIEFVQKGVPLKVVKNGKRRVKYVRVSNKFEVL